MDDALRDAKLRQFANSGDYELACDILREEIERARDELLKCDPADSARVIALHNRAQAFRLLGERFVKRVERAVTDSGASLIQAERYF